MIQSDPKKEINIIGAGVVGVATYKFLEKLGYPSMLVDLEPSLIDSLRQQGMSAALRPSNTAVPLLAFICVPTPLNDSEDGHDLTHVRAAISTLVADPSRTRLTLVLRSTVTPGTCVMIETEIRAMVRDKNLQVDLIYMPEFLRQVSAIEDALNPRMIVAAGPNESAVNELRELLRPCGNILKTFSDYASAEVIKIVHNAWNATKISFWNEIYRIGQQQGVEMSEISKVVAVTSEASWNQNYGIKGGRPFGGACLPKDLMAFIGHVKLLGIEPSMLEATLQINNREHQILDALT